ncbi:MAG: hypothetical protein AAF517_02660 [Planctomycetota bacterium]
MQKLAATLKHVAVLAALLASSLAPAAELKLAKNAKNHGVAQRLAGKWRLDSTLSRRLSGKQKSKRPKAVEFTVDEKALKKVPSDYADALESATLFAAGTVTIGKGTWPFVLSEDTGQPVVIYFPKGKDGSEDLKSLRVFVATAAADKNDILFLAGTQGTSTFAAYGRSGPATPSNFHEDVPVALARRIHTAIGQLKKKELKKLIESFAHPQDIEKLKSRGKTIDEVAKGFERKSERLLKILEFVAKKHAPAKVSETQVVFDISEELDVSHDDIEFELYEGKWYLKN